LESEFAGSKPAETVGFFGHPKNPQYAFLRHVKEPISFSGIAALMAKLGERE
jgi:hypothetical protein